MCCACNFPEGTTPGRGSCLVDLGRSSRVQGDQPDGQPFIWKAWTAPSVPADRILAEPTGQKSPSWISMPSHRRKKRPMGVLFGRRGLLLFSTHTHVQTVRRNDFTAGHPAISLTRA